MVMTNGKKISDNLYEVTYSGQSGESKTITVNFEPQELSPVILHVSRNNVDAGSPVVGVETGYSTPDNALYYYQDSKELIRLSLTVDRHSILIRLEKRMILNHCR